MQSEYRVKRIYTEEDGGVVAKCYDIIYGEDFEKYLGYPDDFDGKENASMLLQDSTYEMSDELRAKIEELFNITEFDDEQDYDGYQFFDFDDDFDEEDDDEDEMNQKALAMLGKRESFNLREALNQIDIDTYNKYDLLNLYESCNLKEDEKRALANIVYDQEDPSVIYDTLNNRYITGEEIGMPERVKDSVIHNELEESKIDDYSGDDLKFIGNAQVIKFSDLPNIGERFKSGIVTSINKIGYEDGYMIYEVGVTEPDSLEGFAEFDYDTAHWLFAIKGFNESVEDDLGDDENSAYNKLKKNANSIKESFPRNIDLDQVVMQVANLVDDKALGDDWIEVFPTRDASPSAAGEYFIPLEITGPDDVTKKATFRTRNGRVEVAFLNSSEAMCDSAESIARFIAGEFGLNIGGEGYTTTKPIKESDEETPYTKEEVEADLKSITHNFTDKEGNLKCGFEEEKNFAVEILKQHYRVVEPSGDDRRGGTWYNISFAEPLIDGSKSIKESANTMIYLFPELTDEDLEMLKAYGLQFLGINHGADGSEENWVVRGQEAALRRYADKYLGYELHPGYLYDEEDFAGDIIKESITNSPLSTSGPIPYAVKLLYQMDKFVMDVYDNEGWLMNGVPDGEFEETTADEAMQNYTEHTWLIEDEDSPDGINWGDFNDFIDTFKRVTKSKDYDQEERNKIIDEADTLVREYAKYKD